MRWLITNAAVVVCAFLSPTAAFGITFGEWASDHGYSPGAVMPGTVSANSSSIDSLSGIDAYNWTSTPTTTLQLYDNQLTSIEAGDFSGLTNLTELSLYNNEISSIEPGDFDGLTNLKKLHLGAYSSHDGGNRISSIEPGDFAGLTNLETLWLSHNQLSSIEADDFSGLSNLTLLSLAGNQLTSIEPGDFAGLTNLTELQLWKNQLSSIEPGDFSDVPNLTALSLSGNQISSIEAGDFSGLTNLTALGLEGNQLTSIEPGRLDGLPNLLTLGLHGNQLTSVPADISGLTNLTSLFLHHNQLPSIEADDFNGLTSLELLWLDHNQLSSIETGAFSGLAKLGYLHLGHNPTLTELNLANADFSSLTDPDAGSEFDVSGNVNVTRVSLRNAVLGQYSLYFLLCGDVYCSNGISVLPITELDLSGVDFAAVDLLVEAFRDARPFVLTDLWLVNTRNLDAVELDKLLDKLPAMQRTDVEGVLYMTRADYDAFNAAGGGLLEIWHNEPGHHVAFVPEPASLLLCCVTVGLLGGWRKRVGDNPHPAESAQYLQPSHHWRIRRITMKRTTCLLASFMISVFFAAASQAVPIASDSFFVGEGGYTPDTTILNQDPTIGAPGFVGPWGVCCTPNFVPIPGGLTHELSPGTPMDGQLVSNTTVGYGGAFSARHLSRAIDYTPTDGTYYISVLLNKNVETTRGDLLAGLGRTQDGDTGILDVDGTWIGFVDGGISFMWGPDAHITSLLSRAQTNVGETYVALLEYDFSTSGPDTVTATVYDGSSERVTIALFPGLDLDATMGRFSVLTQAWEPIPRLDEWRFGTELSDVLVEELVNLRTFGDWASEQGYAPGSVMPATVDAQNSSLESLQGIGDFDWITTPTTALNLGNNQILAVESGSFSAPTDLTELDLSTNQISIIAAGAFSGLANLTNLNLRENQIATIAPGAFDGLTSLPELDLSSQQLSSLAAGTFSGLTNLTTLSLWYNQLSNIEAGDFAGLSNLTTLSLGVNEIRQIEAGAFSDLANLTNLDLMANQLSSIEPGDFNGLTNLTRLGLGGNNISTIKAGAFAGLTNLTELELSYNQIRTIEAGAFVGLSSLPVLNLFNQQLSSLAAGTFEGLTNLTELELSLNRIATIEAGAFSGLSSLPVLNLSDQQLSSLAAGIFEGLTNLTELHLSFNQIATIEAGTFDGLTNLTALNLGYNQLSSIEAYDFSGLTNLSELSLWGNQLSTIEADDFSGLPNLTWLYLSNNQLSNVEADDFSGLTSLTGLSLSGNQIASTEADDFSGLPNLTWLDLSYNQLSSIEAEDFSGMTNLTTLLLNGNQLSSIEAGAFSGLPNLTVLYVGENPTLTALNLAEADFSSLAEFDVAGNVNVTAVLLKGAVLNQTSLVALMDGAMDPFVADYLTGIGDLAGVTELDLSGINFASITDLAPLYVMDDLTDLWLVDTQNLDAMKLDVLLDNLATMEETAVEGVLYMTQADFNAFNTAGSVLLAVWHAEAGHHIEFVLPGDFNGNGIVDAADFTVWRDQLGQAIAMPNETVTLGMVTPEDYDAWKANFGAMAGSGSATTFPAVPEPATLLLCCVAVGVSALCRRRAASCAGRRLVRRPTTTKGADR